MEKILVSLIVPCYNVEKYVFRCLRSIEQQTYKDLEVIVVDDGSTDQTLEIARKFKESSSLNLRLIRQSNAGVSCARNLGIEVSSGQYICFVDSDDEIDKYYIEHMLKSMLNFNTDIAFCNHIIIDEHSNLIQKKHFKKSKVVLINNTRMLYKMLYHKESFAIWAMLAKKEFFETVNFKEGCRYSEDLEVVWKVTALASKICIIHAPLYYYRKRFNSAMAIVDDKRLDGLDAMYRLEEFFQKNNDMFYKDFRKIAVSRWIWATLWQEAISCNDYKKFETQIKKYNPRVHLKKLLLYPQLKVSISSIIFLLSQRIYFKLVRILLT